MSERWVTLGLLMLAAACSADPRTEVVVRIEADPGVRARMARLRVVVENLQDADAVELDRTVTIGRPPDDVELPVEVPLYPKFGDASRRFRITAEALEAGLATPAFARVEAESGYLKGQTLLLVLRFEDDCLEQLCTQGQTCRAGRCASSRVAPDTLGAYSPLDAGPRPRDGGMDGGDGGPGDAGDAGAGDAGDAGDAGNPCDVDGDGFRAAAARCGGDDCNDGDPGVHPGAAEVCDGADQDCDGMIDDGVRTVCYRDGDGDGFGAGAGMEACVADGCGTGLVEVAGDCDDAVRAVSPGATESCNGIDDDCDGTTDPGCACTDGTMRECGSGMVGGASQCRRGVQRCAGGTLGPCEGSVDPGVEVCDGAVDENCDGAVDEGLRIPCWPDADGDGRGASGVPAMMVCPGAMGACPAGLSPTSDDCADDDPARRPGVVEACNGVDDDCNGVVPDAEADRDRDGVRICDVPSDCDDMVATTAPGMAETCNRVDDNCDGSVDEGIACGTPPSPIRPLDGFRTGSVLAAARGTLRPTFSWQAGVLAAGEAVVHHVQVASGCVSGRGCTFATLAAENMAVAATQWTPASDLTARATAPVGTRYAWRVRACSAMIATRCTDWSSPRYLDVGRAYRDLDGDGRSDVVAGTGGDATTDAAAGSVGLFPADIRGIPFAARTLVHPLELADTAFGFAVAVGDFDGDFYDDVVVGAPRETVGGVSHAGTIYLFVRDPAADLPIRASSFVSAPTASTDGNLGASLASAGDLDGDGIEDLVAGAPGAGTVLALRGGTAGLTLAASRTLSGSGAFGTGLAGGGDSSGDARADVAVGAPSDVAAGIPTGRVHVFHGADGFFTASGAADRVISPTPATAPIRFGAAVAFVGRINGDLLDDLAIGAPSFSTGRGRVTVYGSAGVVGAFAGVTAGGQLGSSLAGVGDLDGDGQADLAAGAPQATVGSRCFVFRGNGATLATPSALEPAGMPGSGTQLCRAIAGATDLQGDGFSDLVVTEPEWRNDPFRGRGLFFHGSASWPPADASGSFGTDSAEPATELFGRALAALSPGRPSASPLLALVRLLLAPSRGHAQPTRADRAGARAAFRDGVQALEAGQPEQAAGLFERSLALFPNPPAAFNLATCLRQLGRLARAAQVLDELLGGAFGELAPERRSEATELRNAISDEQPSITVSLALDRTHEVTPRVTLDEHEVTGPTPVLVDPGEHVVRAEAAGHVTVVRRVTLERGHHERVELRLVPIETPRPPPPPAPRRPRPRRGPSLVERPLFWVGVGAVVVGAALTAIVVVAAQPGVEEPLRDPVFGATATLPLE